MADVSRIKINTAELQRLLQDPAIRRALMEQGQKLAHKSRVRAPKLSGAGAASIRPEYVLDGPTPEVRVSWDREHFYMYFHQRGTRTLPAHPFMAVR